MHVMQKHTELRKLCIYETNCYNFDVKTIYLKDFTEVCLYVHIVQKGKNLHLHNVQGHSIHKPCLWLYKVSSQVV